MSDLERRLSAPTDPRGRLISIFVGAVLLPSIALSVLSFHDVPRYAETLRIGLLKQADKVLYYTEKELEMMARARALEAARAVGPERLLEGRPEVIRTALDQAGLTETQFDTLRLETWSPVTGLKAALSGSAADDVKMLRDALKVYEAAPAGPEGEDSIALMLLAGLYLAYANVQRESRLSRLKSDFVANVSHELKTPLALIRLFAETLEMGRVPGEEKAKQYYRIINKESQRLTQLINNILDFSRIEAGRKQYRFVLADVTRIVSDVVEAYRFPIEQQGFTLEVEIAEDLKAAEVDPESIEQALLNLVNNAIKYSSDEKYIKIAVRPQGETVLISVRDKGLGVAKADQKRIFEKFYRAENTLVHTTKGSGLGLSLVQHIMEAHGRTVDLESTPGHCSTVTLALCIKRSKS